jgi:hypothetical protein
VAVNIFRGCSEATPIYRRRANVLLNPHHHLYNAKIAVTNQLVKIQLVKTYLFYGDGRRIIIIIIAAATLQRARRSRRGAPLLLLLLLLLRRGRKPRLYLATFFCSFCAPSGGLFEVVDRCIGCPERLTRRLARIVPRRRCCTGRSALRIQRRMGVDLCLLELLYQTHLVLLVII